MNLHKVQKWSEGVNKLMLNAYYSEANGWVCLVNDTIYVDEVYTIPKDVDFTTGNISHTGAIMVNRDVLRRKGYY